MPVGTLPTVAMTPPGVRIHQRQRVSSSEVASKDISLEIKPKSMHSLSQLATVTVTSRAGSLLSQRSVPLNYMEDPTIAQVIEGVGNKEDAQFYLGKRVAYVYRAKREVNGSKVRVIWGRVTRPHGNSGVVKGKFRSNIPPKAFGASVRIVSSLVGFSLVEMMLMKRLVDVVPVDDLKIILVEWI